MKNQSAEAIRDLLAPRPAQKPTMSGTTFPQTPGDVCSTELDQFILDQLHEQEKKLASDHVEQLSQVLLHGNRREVRDWITRRIALEDSVGQLYAVKRMALLRNNGLTKLVLLSLRELDKLVTNSHRRAMDWLEVLRRLDQHEKPTIRIDAANQVAILSGSPKDDR